MAIKVLAMGGDGVGPEVVDAAGIATRNLGGKHGTQQMTGAVNRRFRRL